MRQHLDNEGDIRNYLLGSLDPEGRQRVEEKLLTDDDFFDELLASEDDLIDRYLSGLLPAVERERFENFFLSTPERQQKLRFARAFNKYLNVAASIEAEAADAVDISTLSSADATDLSTLNATDSSPARVLDSARQTPLPTPVRKKYLPSFLQGPRPAWSFALAAALLVFVFGGSWWLLTKSSGDDSASRRGTGAGVFAVTLTPGLARDAGATKRLEIPSGTQTVRLQLETDGAHATYEARLENFEGRELRRFDRLTADSTGAGAVVNLDVPASLFERSDYQVRLRGFASGGEPEDAGRYSFRVVNK
ncbi:MAG TPA: hypothetical protein VNA19_02285 [Pyrinomonadaceae bacterium]|jgi:anti-sigma factor RsiW|nr:hypothetical protein [Pyrinomonadaceae bacterium]